MSHAVGTTINVVFTCFCILTQPVCHQNWILSQLRSRYNPDFVQFGKTWSWKLFAQQLTNDDLHWNDKRNEKSLAETSPTASKLSTSSPTSTTATKTTTKLATLTTSAIINTVEKRQKTPPPTGKPMTSASKEEGKDGDSGANKESQEQPAEDKGSCDSSGSFCCTDKETKEAKKTAECCFLAKKSESGQKLTISEASSYKGANCDTRKGNKGEFQGMGHNAPEKGLGFKHSTSILLLASMVALALVVN